MNLILNFIPIIVISYLFSSLGKKLKISSEVSLIIFGIFLGFPGLSNIFIGNNQILFAVLSNIGLFSLMFLAGLESSWKTIKKEEKDSFYIALFAAIIPFFLGLFFFKFFFSFNWVESFIIGICMSITAEATKAKILFELGKLKTRLGSTMIGAGIIDDIFGLSLFALLMLFVGIFDFKEYFILFGVLFSFILGLLVQKFAREHHLTKKLEFTLDIFFIPFFFISMGTYFNLFSLLFSPLLLCFIIILAIVGKIFGTLLAKPFLNFNRKQLYLVGWAMNSRGAIELALALIAFKAALINEYLYSALVLMALVTTLIFPFIITKMIKNNPRIMY